MISLADIPLPADSPWFEFSGFLGFLWDAESRRLYRFGTYTGATASLMIHRRDKRNEIQTATGMLLVIRDAQFELTINATHGSPTATNNDSAWARVWGPVQKSSEGRILQMKPFITEMLNSTISVRLTQVSDDKVVFQSVGQNAGLEIMR